MQAYLDLLRDIRDNGSDRGDRTGTGTRSVFGRQLRFDLRAGFPLLTTKKIHFKSVANELIWFLSGDTNTAWLKENGVSIWDEWATENGDLGPLYGAQWRSWPTRDGSTIDQLAYVLDCLKKRPESRRILFHGWNVEYLPDETQSPQDNVRAGRMALPPCHLLYQFYVANGALSAQLYIRSSDVFWGYPLTLPRWHCSPICSPSKVILRWQMWWYLWVTPISIAITPSKCLPSWTVHLPNRPNCVFSGVLRRFMGIVSRTLN